MGRTERNSLIETIEKLRGSRVIAYVLGDRQPVITQIGDDAVRPIHDHLRSLGRIPRLDLFIYSRGGAIDVPWRLATALRHAADEWNILVPFRANSAATLLALGADEILLGRQGELGPIDPIMNITRPGPTGPMQDNISVEDVMAYAAFVRERSGLTDQSALTMALTKLVDRLDAVALGNAYRNHSHIRYVARHMLLSRSKERAGPEQVIDAIIETLAERVYAHGHAIGISEAHDMGLHVVEAPQELDEAMWSLLNEYESDLKILEPIDPADVLGDSDRFTEDVTTGCIESTWGFHEFSEKLEISAQRQVPSNLQVTVNLPLMLPAGVNPDQLPVAVQQMLQQAQQGLAQAAQQAVQEAMREQAQLIGFQVRRVGGKWRLKT